MTISNIESTFLLELIRNKTPVSIYLRHGIRLRGNLVGQDEKTLFLEDTHGVQMILKNAVSTITPDLVF
jgi:host factor-I protein